MATVLITYDLHKLGQRYADLKKKIEASFPTYWHCLESTYIVETSLTADQVVRLVMGPLDSNDELVAVGLDGSWSSIGLSKQCSDWLQSNV